MTDRCECYDTLCAAEHIDGRCEALGKVALRRIDMDGGAVVFCYACSDDALDSGVFTTVDDDDDDEGSQG